MLTLSFYSQSHKHLQIFPLNRDNGPQPPIKKLYDEIHDRKIGKTKNDCVKKRFS